MPSRRSAAATLLTAFPEGGRTRLGARELEVPCLVLEGWGTPQIAATLDVADSTAHDHVKRMMMKTRSRNRVELAAKTLGWRGA